MESVLGIRGIMQGRTVDDERASETVNILNGELGMVPMGAFGASS
jgi:hypothetical protein